MNKILSLTILSLAFAWGFGADTDKPLPKAASDVVAELNASKTLAMQKAIKKLQVVMGDLTRRGDLDGANATKAVMDGLQKGLDSGTTEDSQNIVSAIVGKWEYSKVGGGNATLVLNENKVIDNPWGEKWTYEIKDTKLIIHPTGSKQSDDMIFQIKIDKNMTFTGTQGPNVVKLVKLN